jgi:PTH2 family peptidyl-tRNA hydrolase
MSDLNIKNTKQVIVWRNDLKVRTGKKMAMASHASMSFLTKGGKVNGLWKSHDSCDHDPFSFFKSEVFKNKEHAMEVDHWLENSFRKICVYVNSEQELKELHQKALDKGLISHIVEDNGATEFNGVKTLTCLAIGPHFCSKFEGLTDHLPLL